jgi:hypothetical protein
MLAVLAAWLLTGCSAIKLGYEQGPSLSYWWLDAHLDFNSSQSPQVREALDRLQRWHRQRELPLYADLLARTATLAEGPIDAEQVCQVEREVLQRLDALQRETIRAFSPVAAQIDARQIRHLSTHLEQKNARWEDEWMQGSASARLQRRLDKQVDRYTDFYGSLSSAQTRLLRRHLEQSLWSPEWGRQERLRQQRDLLGTLMRIEQENLPARSAETALLGVWERWLTPPAEADRQRWQAWLEQGCKNLAELHNSTSAEQRQRAARRLRAYEKDLRELAGRS